MPDFGPRWTNPQLLDRGGQALTYTVVDGEVPGNCQRVAKILNNPSADRRSRFLQEIEVTETFSHPNVVQSISRGETQKSRMPYFVMPFYGRGTLAENHGRLGSPLDRLTIFLQICRGVAYAHGKGLIHRDLKPANIFVTEVGIPVVGDFGLCYRHEPSDEGRLTMTHEAVGARKYMPPEWREGREARPQPTGDIYSLGKMLYWIFAGTEYDGHEDDHSTPERSIVKMFWSPEDERTSARTAKSYMERWALAHSAVDRLILRTLRKRVEDRLGSVSELIEETRSLIDSVEAGGRVLDLNLPKRCLFCATGTYRPAHGLPIHNFNRLFFPDIHQRKEASTSKSSLSNHCCPN